MLLIAASLVIGDRQFAAAQVVTLPELPRLDSIEDRPTPDAKPPTGRLSAAALNEHIEAVRQAWEVPGLSVAIVKNGETVFSQGFGVREVGRAELVDSETLFAIASNSKAFTSAALAMLVDEGKVRWDDPVSDYLPWLRLRDPLAADLRVRDLLCHRSGLGTFSGDLLWWGTSYSPREVLERAKELEPAAPFRAKYGYSNLMFLAAGQVVEEVSGQTWAEYVNERILTPVEMKRTKTSVRDLISDLNYATPHKTTIEDSQPLSWMNWDTMAAAGGIISCSDDMAAWLKLQLRRGAADDSSVNDGRLFSPEQSHEMWSAQTVIPVSASSIKNTPETQFKAYGLGWVLSDYHGRKLVGHGGGYDGMYSKVVMVPEENLGVVVLTNSMTGVTTAIANHIVDAYLGLTEKDWSGELLEQHRRSRKEFQERIDEATKVVTPNTKPSRDLEHYAGRFSCKLYGDAQVTLEPAANRESTPQLVLRLLPNPQLIADLEHLHYDTFRIRWRHNFAWFGDGNCHFVANAQGEFSSIELDVPNDDLWFYELDLQRADAP